ncbi:MAG: hypothetical protein H0T08_03500 [Acidobacteria bacterium]|nr:hypothetical protein [Acidobacteriota bacterium]
MSEIYFDGKLLQKFGRVATRVKASNLSGEVEQNPRRISVSLAFETSGEHIIMMKTKTNGVTNDFWRVCAWSRMSLCRQL